MFKLEFATDNAAFGDNPTKEAARILREVAARLDEAPNPGSLSIGGALRDENGNAVGKWSLKVEG